MRSPGSEVVVSRYDSLSGTWDAGVILGTGISPDVAISATINMVTWSDPAGGMQSITW